MLYLLITLISFFHPFHVSVCEVEFQEKSKSAEVSIKVFLDDIESDLRKTGDPKIDIIKLTQQERDSLVKIYINNHFSLKFDRMPKKVKFIGSEIEREALWCYMEIQNLEKFKSIQIKNTILYEVFDDQVNLVNVTISGVTQSTKLNFSKPFDELTF